MLLCFALFVLTHFIFIDSWLLRINPPDIYVSKNDTLKASCHINKNDYIQANDLKFSFEIDGEDDNKVIKIEDVSISSINVNNSIAYIEYHVYFSKFKNSVLVCYYNESIKTRSMIFMGELPHNVTSASCFVKNWKDMHCEVTTSGKNDLLTTYWTYELSDKTSRQIKFNKTMSSVNHFVVKNLFDNCTINDIMEMKVFGWNKLGYGFPNRFEFVLKNLVVPDQGNLSLNRDESNIHRLLLVPPKVDESYLVSFEVNCSNFTYKFEKISEGFDRIIVMELNEDHLPAAHNCSASAKLKPLNYGRFSDESNIIKFKTRDKVPLKNPYVFNSSFDVQECDYSMVCIINIYFKPLTVEEARGVVVEYEVTLLWNRTILNVSYHRNDGLPFITIKGLNVSHDNKLFVTIKAATIAGYNESIIADPMLLNIFDYLPSIQTNVSRNKLTMPQLPLYVIFLNDSHANLVLDNDYDKIYIVWCLFDKIDKKCKGKFDWVEIIDVKRVVKFVVPSGDELNDYNFGLQLGVGIQWMKSPCYFIASHDSKPETPSLHDITGNETHIIFNVPPPKCSITKKENFPRKYLVEVYDIMRSGTILNKTFEWFKNPLILDGLYSGDFNVSVLALPWNQGNPLSDKFYFRHTSLDDGNHPVIVYVVLAIVIMVTIMIVVIIICYAGLGQKFKPKGLKVEIPNVYSANIESNGTYSKFNSNGGYTICEKESMLLGTKGYDENVTLKTSRDCVAYFDQDTSTTNSSDSSSVDNSSIYNYAVTKMVDHSLCLKESLSIKHAKPIHFYESSQESENQSYKESDLLSEKFYRDGFGPCGIENDTSSKTSLTDYPPVKIIMTPQKQNIENSSFCYPLCETGTMNEICCNNLEVNSDASVFVNNDNDDASDCYTSSDSYCKKSVFRKFHLCQRPESTG